MNVLTRGIRGAIRSPIRAGAIIIMLAISIGLIVAMLAAKAGVENKIASVKATSATSITVTPAGLQGFGGGGNPLTAAQIATVQKVAHVASTTSTLSDRLSSSDTNLTSSLQLGSFGARQFRIENGSGSSSVDMPEPPADSSTSTTETRSAPITITGTTDANSVATNGGSLTISSGSTIDVNASDYEALVGKDLASKNNLNVGSTFTAYSQTISVKGIYTTGNTFQDSGIIMPLATVQNLTSQAGAVTQLLVNADSSDNVAAVVSNIKSALGSAADVTSEQQRAADSASQLSSISNLATTGVIGATVASAVIVLLTMTMIVRERKREIGVIKAIGGTNFKVIAQFMTEALTLTIIGGIIGLALGVAVSGSITQGLVDSQTNSSAPTQRLTGGPGGAGGFTGGIRRFGDTTTRGLQAVTSSVTPATIAGGIGLTLLIAILGSAIPAWLIARIRPAEVLRTE